MSENVIHTPVVTESPASWNTKYIDPSGFVCQLTLRAESGKELLDKAATALAYLLDQGCQPVNSFGNGYKKNAVEPANGNGKSPDHHANPSWCAIHEVEMKKWEKDGRVWYSHKHGEGWCSGKAKNGK